MISKNELDRYADTGFPVRLTLAGPNIHLFRKMLEKTGAERLIIGGNMADTARRLVWSGIPKDLPEQKRRQLFLQRFYGENLIQ